eukprot:m.39704 g.39704  ORF g.39704 m.39704 type:complete len:513 (+) comp5848_c0_seq2:111-1649(+)
MSMYSRPYRRRARGPSVLVTAVMGVVWWGGAVGIPSITASSTRRSGPWDLTNSTVLQSGTPRHHATVTYYDANSGLWRRGGPVRSASGVPAGWECQRPQRCTRCYGQNTKPCGFKCYGAGQPCASDCQDNKCPGAGCAESVAVDWMNQISCNWPSQYWTNPAVCNVQLPGPVQTCSYATCADVTPCTPDTQYQVTPPTPSSNTVCSDVTACDPNTQYQVLPPTATSDRVCQSMTTCNSSDYEAVPATPTTDRLCLPPCNCSVGITYESVPQTPTTNRVCSGCGTCTLGTTYESAAPTYTTDRVCSPVLASCPVYELHPPTLTSDRQCTTNLSLVCNADTSYVAHAPTPTTSAVCQSLRSSCPTVFEDPVGGTLTSDRVCKLNHQHVNIGIAVPIATVVLIGVLLYYKPWRTHRGYNNIGGNDQDRNQNEPRGRGRGRNSYGACNNNEQGRNGHEQRIRECAICFDNERECVFVPCGHMGACGECARNVLLNQNSICPFCRSEIERSITVNFP